MTVQQPQVASRTPPLHPPCQPPWINLQRCLYHSWCCWLRTLPMSAGLCLVLCCVLLSPPAASAALLPRQPARWLGEPPFPWLQHRSNSSSSSTASSISTTSSSSNRRIIQQQPQQPALPGPSQPPAGGADASDPTQRTTWDAEPSYAAHYSSDAERPNLCKVAHKVDAPLGRQKYTFNADAKDYIPYIGTSVVRDSQLMLLRLYYSIDFPVKYFVVVVGAQASAGKNAIAYEVRHLLEYPLDKVGVVIITCEHQPSVSESWNAVFQTYKDEPWGVYMARDTFWERGALAKLAPHGWEAAASGQVDVGYVKWSNMGEREAIHNIFMMTSKSVKRFGLWDENIFPALCEDIDMFRRMKIMDPPMKEHQYLDVLAVHGKRTDTNYVPGAWLPDDPHVAEEKELTHLTVHVRHGANCNYFMRKWGCPSEAGNWMHMTDDCKFKTPFNKSVPQWYWHTNKAMRQRDRYLTVRGTGKKDAQGQETKALLDSRSNEVVFEVPAHYGLWGGYFEQSRICRLSGYLGRTTAPDGRTMCL